MKIPSGDDMSELIYEDELDDGTKRAWDDDGKYDSLCPRFADSSSMTIEQSGTLCPLTRTPMPLDVHGNP